MLGRPAAFAPAEAVCSGGLESSVSGKLESDPAHTRELLAGA